MEHLDTAIVLIPLLAVIAPLAARAIGPRLRVPVVVFELALGFLVPLFFIYTGVTFDLASLLDDPGMLSVLLFPLIGMALRGDRVSSTTVRVDDEV
ncbi:hypothetical protein BOH66_14645 [Microbacterium aurum]|uniref:Sodium:proton antiporter n=1 Tax=Microbacterium aurum TaxID=36805 RepID=A0A1P8UB91_9MICO|nr:hypothetical protein [Microbacterium aurum]APZ35346.1 hypothetical protein BOH66_14645 [Microbacterium aurum]MBM7825995.1 Kef-type K+ transport system membrane component KefB [Microbacterium aurum]